VIRAHIDGRPDLSRPIARGGRSQWHVRFASSLVPLFPLRYVLPDWHQPGRSMELHRAMDGSWMGRDAGEHGGREGVHDDDVRADGTPTYRCLT
jgi:hypothetical protein